ncbi:DeoR/GlpR family DNA-binding transcription regulator [Cohnella cholangitidis]|uniref:DeoR/GlpR family DNA-binding transcription regulator n=1 Tax=Cohnella cholangitidis TaxID=2598458 RepID=UPI0015FB87D8|nr:DeoR/GlpR family DNA-binding transcription regulator [Cohnella cholangitidis]
MTKRHESILEILKDNSDISIAEMSAQLQVSEMTVRRDLEALENENLLVRVRGGAKLIEEQPESDNSFLNRRFYNQAAVHQQEKKAIGKLAASLVHNDETILIDAGSTALELTKHLHGKRGVTAVVTTINIAEELEGREGVTTIITGGVFRSRTTTLMNPILNQMLKQIHADKVFIGVTAASITEGFTGNDFLESDIKRLLMQSGKEVYWLVDSSKINAVSSISITPIMKEHHIITDNKISPEVREQLEKKCRLWVAEGE